MNYRVNQRKIPRSNGQRREREIFSCPHCEKSFRKEFKRNDHIPDCRVRIEAESVVTV